MERLVIGTHFYRKCSGHEWSIVVQMGFLFVPVPQETLDLGLHRLEVRGGGIQDWRTGVTDRRGDRPGVLGLFTGIHRARGLRALELLGWSWCTAVPLLCCGCGPIHTCFSCGVLSSRFR